LSFCGGPSSTDNKTFEIPYSESVKKLKKLRYIGNTSLPLEKKSDLSKIDQKQGGTDVT